MSAGNTTSIRAILGFQGLPIVGPGTTAVHQMSVAGVAPGDIAIIAPIMNGVPISAAGSCITPGILDINLSNSNAGPSNGGAYDLGTATIIRATGSI